MFGLSDKSVASLRQWDCGSDQLASHRVTSCCAYE